MTFSKDWSIFKGTWGNAQLEQQSEFTFPKGSSNIACSDKPSVGLFFHRNLRASVSTKATLTWWYIYLISAVTAYLAFQNLVKTELRLSEISKPNKSKFSFVLVSW